MYTAIVNTGEIIRNSDLVVILPNQNIEHEDVLAYMGWLNEGNIPNELFLPGIDYVFNGEGFDLKIDVIKSNKLQELSDKFTEQFRYGKFLSSLGFYVDNRRYADKNDKDNVQGLIDLEITTFKDSDGILHNLTLEELNIIKKEMTEDGLNKYQTKWYFENLINTSEISSEIESIEIVF